MTDPPAAPVPDGAHAGATGAVPDSAQAGASAVPDGAAQAGAPSARRALWLAAVSAATELLLITPWVDHAADGDQTVHFTQHGLIYVGGVAMGFAIRELSRR